MIDHSNDRRARLRLLARNSVAGIVTVAGAAKALREPSRAAALQLARLARGGWVTHIRRGVYLVPPLDAGPNVVVDDPWVLATALFAPCYVGGWSAVEHWGLTEQLFRSTFVVTAAHIRVRTQRAAGASFQLTRVARDRVESVGLTWRGAAQVRVSNVERTIVDALVDPAWVGGVRHLGAVLESYRESKGSSAERLASALARHGNGAAHKRAGLLASLLWPDARALVAQAEKGKTRGVVRLDPAVGSRGAMSTRWGLWVNVRVTGASQ